MEEDKWTGEQVGDKTIQTVAPNTQLTEVDFGIENKRSRAGGGGCLDPDWLTDFSSVES